MNTRLAAVLAALALPASAQLRAPARVSFAASARSAAPTAGATGPALFPPALAAVPFAAPMAAPPAAPSAALAAPAPDNFVARARDLFAEVRRAEREREGVRAQSVPTDDDMRGRVDRLPTTNPEREKYMVDLFRLAGARPEEIVRQDVGRGRHNIMVVKKGRADRVIVVGGHHDKVSVGAGSIDNGTGATMVANLYQALRDQKTDATIVFIAFAREEEGLLGSAAYLRALAPDQRGQIEAMVNLDTLAVDGTYSWKNNSTRALLDRAAEVAARFRRALTEAYLDGGDADSSSFRGAGIPAVTIYGASQDVIFDIIHSERDTMAAFDLGHYKNAYLLTLELLKSLDRDRLGPVGRGNV